MVPTWSDTACSMVSYVASVDRGACRPCWKRQVLPQQASSLVKSIPPFSIRGGPTSVPAGSPRELGVLPEPPGLIAVVMKVSSLSPCKFHLQLLPVPWSHPGKVSSFPHMTAVV